MIRIPNGGFAWAVLAVLVTTSSLEAGSPWYVPWEGPWPWSRFEGSRRIDVIGPIGNRLPESYRRKYNRPSYISGKIVAKIAPSSQGAMSFNRSEELGLYDDNGIKGAMSLQHCPPKRVEQHYFYPKPWEVLTVGPRRDRSPAAETNRDLEPPGFRELLKQSNALDDVLETTTPVGELELPMDELEPLLDDLVPPEQAPPEDGLEL